MTSLIIVHADFDRIWPFAADHYARLWEAEGPLLFIRVEDDDRRPLGELAPDQVGVTRLVALHVPVTVDCIRQLEGLEEAVFQGAWAPGQVSEELELLKMRGVSVYEHPREGYWGQSVAEYGLALTLSGLRRIPQLHHAILSSQAPWSYAPPENRGRPGVRGAQYGDDSRWTNGTVAGKRVRVVGAGNIASRYASFVNMLGADVAAWDPFATEPNFHRAGARREWHLDELMKNADILAPMLPLTPQTRGIVTQEHIESLPKGCLVVLVTRANICDMPTLRRRVLADELALAADVFDVEPLPLDDPLLGRDNVVHTPHNAGRTIHANQQWAEELAAQFRPVQVNKPAW